MDKKKIIYGLGFVGLAAAIYSLVKKNKQTATENYHGVAEEPDPNFQPKKLELMHEYMDSLRNPITETTPVNLKAKIRLSNCNATQCTLEDGSIAENSESMINSAKNESTISFRTSTNASYLNNYISPAAFNVATRDGKTYADLLAPRNVKATIHYLINHDYDKDLSEGSPVTASPELINSTKDIFARILEKEVGLQSGRASQYWITSSVEKRINEGLDSSSDSFINYSSLGDLTYSREAAAILWVALNRMKFKKKKALDMLADGWNPQVYNEVSSEINSGIKPDEAYYKFVDDFFEGLYPNEIGHRMAFVHYPRQISSGKLPDWTLPVNHNLYPKNRGASKTAGGIVVGSAIFADSRYDPNTKKHILPYTDNKRN